MKYDGELGNIRTLLSGAQKVLIALSSNPSVDDLAAGLALYLSLKQSGKEVSIVTEGTILVGHTNLFGVGNIQNKLPEGSGGDYTIVLSGVASDGKVPAVGKMDYFTTGTDLNLVFRVLPGQKFEPTSVTPKPAGGNFDLVFVLGASSLQALGGISGNKPEAFTNTHLVNISNAQDNTRFGSTNIVDPASSSVSEIVEEILTTLQLPYETDIASNILTGIFAVTNSLQSGNTGADTFAVVADALRRGGQKPVTQSVTAQIEQTAPQVSQQPAAFDLSKIFNAPVNLTQPVASSGGVEQKIEMPQPSAEETPMGEGAESLNPEADWLTPKIFRGKGG